MHDEYNIRGERREQRRNNRLNRMPKHNLTGVHLVAEAIVRRDREKLEAVKRRKAQREEDDTDSDFT